MLVTSKKPVYPPFAAAAHVKGKVVVKMLVSNEGAVEKAFIVSGPEVLRSSSIDAAKGYVFRPLKAGAKAVPFETNVACDFSTFGTSSSTVTSKS
jgi:outer membrane biosynthesis protein TonB